MSKARKPLGPPPHLLLGHLFGGLPDKLGFLVHCAAKYGDVVDLSLGPRTYMLTNPEDIKHVLVTNNLNYTKTRRLTSETGKRLAGEGLITSTGRAAIPHRRILQPMFSQAALGNYAEVIVRSTQELIARWRSGMVLDMAAEMMRLTRQIIGKILLGVDLLNETPELAAAMTTQQRYIHYRFRAVFPLPVSLPTRRNRDYRRAMRYLDQAINDMIKARRASPASFSDLLAMFIQAQDHDGNQMSDKLVRDEAVTMTSTGYETIGAALAWTWYLLAQHPHITEKLVNELQTLLGDRWPHLEDVAKLDYAERVLLESMRIYPPTWIFVRLPQANDKLPSGFDLRAGAKLYLSPYVSHRNPAYFPEPEQFDPERFTAAAQQTRPKFAYFPFSGGPRVCLGQAFAMMEGVLIMACIASRFRMELLPDHRVEPDPGQSLFPKPGIMMRVAARSV